MNICLILGWCKSSHHCFLYKIFLYAYKFRASVIKVFPKPDIHHILSKIVFHREKKNKNLPIPACFLHLPYKRWAMLSCSKNQQSTHPPPPKCSYFFFLQVHMFYISLQKFFQFNSFKILRSSKCLFKTPADHFQHMLTPNAPSQ